MRLVWLVMDSVGCGALPDADLFDDAHANTLLHIKSACPNLRLENLLKLGLGNIPDTGFDPVEHPMASYGRCREISPAKDTVTGHWEMAGIITQTPPQTFPNGFAQSVIDEIKHFCGRGVLCNRPASGTQVIDEYGDQHVKTGDVILYTSADSVMQIAAHEEVMPLPELYALCQHMRIFMGHEVGRIIARPFIGENGDYVRTSHRHDYALPPPQDTVLSILQKAGYPVVGVGKIGDIFADHGLTCNISASGNDAVMQAVLDQMANQSKGIIMANLVDFDMLYGHRRDVVGYARALEKFDQQLGSLLPRLSKEDALVIAADHGCDPTHHHTDHTREYVPLLWMDRRPVVDLGTLDSLAAIGQLVLEYFNLKKV